MREGECVNGCVCARVCECVWVDVGARVLSCACARVALLMQRAAILASAASLVPPYI